MLTKKHKNSTFMHVKVIPNTSFTVYTVYIDLGATGRAQNTLDVCETNKQTHDIYQQKPAAGLTKACRSELTFILTAAE